MPLGATWPVGALEGRGPVLETQNASQGWVGGGNTPHSSPDHPILDSPCPSASPLLPPPPFYAPRTNTAWRGPWRVGDLAWKPSRLPGAEWVGETLGTFTPDPLSPWGSLQTWEPSPLPATPQERQSYLASTSPAFSLLPHPTQSFRGSPISFYIFAFLNEEKGFIDFFIEINFINSLKNLLSIIVGYTSFLCVIHCYNIGFVFSMSREPLW